MIKGKSNQACGALVQLGLQEARVHSTVPGFGVFAMATGGHLRLFLWSAKVRVVRWDTMGPDGSHLS